MLSVERGAIRKQRRAGSNEHGAIRKERAGRDAEGQVSSTKQFVTGAEGQARRTEQSGLSAWRQVLNAEQSGDNTRAKGAEHGAIRARRTEPSVERGVIRERGEALKCWVRSHP